MTARPRTIPAAALTTRHTVIEDGRRRTVCEVTRDGSTITARVRLPDGQIQPRRYSPDTPITTGSGR